jgi:hypothetical protein
MTPNSRSIPVEFFFETMEYREEVIDGVLQGKAYWKYRENMSIGWNTRYSGKPVGGIEPHGYYLTIITYNGKRCSMRVHTIVWILNNGCYPDNMIDHKDHIKTNNLISNLRQADSYLNNMNVPSNSNASSQYKGVSFKKAPSKWYVGYCLNYKDYHVGCFTDELEAALAYNEAISKVHNAEYAYLNDISMGYTNKEFPNMPRHYEPEKVAA